MPHPHQTSRLLRPQWIIREQSSIGAATIDTVERLRSRMPSVTVQNVMKCLLRAVKGITVMVLQSFVPEVRPRFRAVPLQSHPGP
jgi:hypothetical protein